MAGELTERTCPQCGKTFIPARFNQAYCSERCRYEASYVRKKARKWAVAEPVEAICPQCGKAFIKHHGLQIYCSRRCGYIAEVARAKAKQASRPQAEKTCVVCGKTFRPNMYCGAQRYCSPQCRDRAKAEREGASRTAEEYTCPTCGKTFTPVHRNQVYCSPQCRTAWWAGQKPSGSPARTKASPKKTKKPASNGWTGPTPEDEVFCKGCRYCSRPADGSQSSTCDYILKTGTPRGCRPGVGCVKYEEVEP